MMYDSSMYMHEYDKRALEALKGLPGFDKVQRLFQENFDEKKRRYDLLSEGVRLSERQMPEIYNLLPDICNKLGINIPELFYIQSEDINAATMGTVNPCIFITSELVEKIPFNLISTVLAHECGHIACNHYLYRTMAFELVNGIDNGIFRFIPGARKHITPVMLKAILFWSRCSELSADRAAVLCDGNADKTIDVLLKIRNYDIDINREEFIKQAIDLREFIEASSSNRFLEQMLIKNESHPRLTIRAYESYEWANSQMFNEIKNGTYSPDTNEVIVEEEFIEGEIEIISDGDETPRKAENNLIDGKTEEELNQEMERVNSELARYTNEAGRGDYAYAIACGILSGIVDATYVGTIKFTQKKQIVTDNQVHKFVQDTGGGKDLKQSIRNLEKNKVDQDNIWSGKQIRISTKNHHLADMAHHPTPLGMVSAILVEFTRHGFFLNRDGEWHVIPTKKGLKDALEVYAPLAISGILNWLVSIGSRKYEEENGKEVPASIKKLAHLIASTPLILKIIDIIKNWALHMVSDMDGSSGTPGAGMGIPGIFLSLAYEMASHPILKETGLPQYLNSLYEKGRIDLREEITVYKEVGRQLIPVVLNELLVRTGYFISRLITQIKEHNGLKEIEWDKVMPWRNRTIERMMTVSAMTFTIADTTDAAIHAAMESSGNWVMFAGRFITRYNYIGAGRAVFSIVREISNSHKESQLLAERLMLTEAISEKAIDRLQLFKKELEEKISTYLAEDIVGFLQGFEDIEKGLKSGDANLVIRGNVSIQRILGKSPQFENQEEFDELMENEEALVF